MSKKGKKDILKSPKGQDTQVLEKEKNGSEQLQNEAEGNSETNKLEEELANAKDKYLRLYSEFENFRRRTSKEKLELISTANKSLMSDLVPVLDDFERAMAASESTEDLATLKEGVSLVQSKLSKVLDQKGLKKIEIEKGDDFNDELHEAITQIPSCKKLEGKIVDVIEPGYKLGDAVVRFAKVVVGAKQ